MSIQGQEPIHVVHIIPTLNIGGAERFVISLTESIDQVHIRQSVITLWDSTPLATELPSHVNHITLSLGSVGYLRRVGVVTRALASCGADIVHTHLFGADLWGRLAARRLHIPVVTTEHNINTDESLLRRLVKRWMRGYSQHYTAPSQAISEYMHRAYAVSADTISVIPHGINTARFSSLPAPMFLSPFRIGVVGRLVKQKGHRVLIDALAQLSDLSISLKIIGSGEMKDELCVYAQKKGVSEKIVWQDAVHDIKKEYTLCDIVVVPSIWEGFGLVALEAMASGRLVIASDTGGLPEIVSDQQTGLLFACGDSHALADGMRRAMSDTLSAKAIALRGQAWAVAHGDVRVMARAYATLYQDVVSSSLYD